MKNRNVVCFFIILFCFCSCVNENTHFQSTNTIIPRPKEVKAFSGYFPLNNQTVIYCDSSIIDFASEISQRIEVKTMFAPEVIPFETKGKRQFHNRSISLLIDTTMTGIDAYELDIKPNYMVCRAANTFGLRYGFETLMQLLLKSDHRADATKHLWLFPSRIVKDKAQHEIRSLSTESEILSNQEVYRKYIDLMAHYKLNKLRVAFPRDLWMSDDLVKGQSDSIRSFLLRRYEYASSRGVQLEADVSFVDLLDMELIESSADIDSTAVKHSMESFPAALAMDLALPMLERMERFFPFEKINLGDPALNNTAYFCAPCNTDSTAYTIGLLDSIAVYMSSRGIDVDYSAYSMSYKKQLDLPVALGEGISNVFIVDLNSTDTSVEEVYLEERQENKLYCLASELEEHPQVSAAFLAYADRMWGQYADYNDFVHRITFHTTTSAIKKPLQYGNSSIDSLGFSNGSGTNTAETQLFDWCE